MAQGMNRLVQALQRQQGTVKLPRYDGGSDVRKFLEIFNEVRQINEWTDGEAALHLRLALDGSANECVTGNTIEELQNSLITRYQMTQEEAIRELRRLHMTKGENIHEFGEKVQRLVRIAHPGLPMAQHAEIATRELVEAIGDKWLRREFRLRPAVNFTDALMRVRDYNADMRQEHKICSVSFESPETRDAERGESTMILLVAELEELGLKEVTDTLIAVLRDFIKTKRESSSGNATGPRM